MTLPNQFFGLLCHIFLCWHLKSDLQIVRTEKKITLTCLFLFFSLLILLVFAHLFFFRSLRPFRINLFNIPLAGLPKRISSFTVLCLRVAVAESSAISPLICLGFYFFITSIYFPLLCLSQWQKKKINYFYEASTSLCQSAGKQNTFISRKHFSISYDLGFCKLDIGITEARVSVFRFSW